MEGDPKCFNYIVMAKKMTITRYVSKLTMMRPATFCSYHSLPLSLIEKSILDLDSLEKLITPCHAVGAINFHYFLGARGTFSVRGQL